MGEDQDQLHQDHHHGAGILDLVRMRITLALMQRREVEEELLMVVSTVMVDRSLSGEDNDFKSGQSGQYQDLLK